MHTMAPFSFPFTLRRSLALASLGAWAALGAVASAQAQQPSGLAISARPTPTPVVQAVSVAAPAPTPAPAAPVLSLRTLFESALATHPLLQSARLQARAAAQDVNAVERQRWATVSVIAETDTAQTTTSSASRVLRLDQTVWDAGRNSARIGEAATQAEIAQAQIHVQQHDLFIQIINAWQSLISATERLRVADATLARLDGFQAQMSRRVQADASPAIDLELVQARVLQTRVERTTAETAARVAITRLEQLTSLSSLSPPGTLPALPPVPSLAQTQILAQQLQSTDWQWVASLLPAVRKARLERNLVENRLQTKRAEQWPQLYVRYDQPLAATSTHSSTQGSWFVGFRYTPGAGFSTHAEAQAMATRILSQDQAIEAAIREAENGLQNDREEFFNARNRIGALDLAVQGSEQVLDSYLRQFQAGRKSWLDLLNAARELAQNEYTLVDARAGLVGAMHRLQLRMGQSPDFP